MQEAAPSRRILRVVGWHLPIVIIILAMIVAPGASAILEANSRNAGQDGVGLLLWAVAAGLGFVVFLAVTYVVSYVVSSAWHNAQNARRRP